MCTSLRESLSNLQMEQVDATLIHWPFADVSIPVSGSTGDLLEVKRQRLERLIGMSNCAAAHMQQAIEAIGAERIAASRVEIHLFLQNRKVVEFTRPDDTHPAACMPLAYGRATGDPVLQEVACEHEASLAEVALLAPAMGRRDTVILQAPPLGEPPAGKEIASDAGEYGSDWRSGPQRATGQSGVCA